MRQVEEHAATLGLIVGGGWLTTLVALAVVAAVVARLWPAPRAPTLGAPGKPGA